MAEAKISVEELEFTLYVLVGRHLGLQALLKSLVKQTADPDLIQRLSEDFDKVEISDYWSKFKRALEATDPEKQQYHIQVMSDGFSDFRDNFFQGLISS